MQVIWSLVHRLIVLAMGITVGLAALAPVASASTTDRTCASSATTTKSTTSPLSPDNDVLLTSDGSGFFDDDLTTIAVRPAGSHESITETAIAVGQTLTDFYFGDDVEVFVNLPGPSTRVVIIDSDVAVPGHPTVFTVGGRKTLYLHWTTAEQDLADLLEQPTFGTLIADRLSSCAPPLELDEPDEMLAYIDVADTAASTASATRADGDDSTLAPLPPLARTAPTETWPPLAAAAVAATAGGLALRRRRTQADSDDSIAADTLMEASKPALPVADRPPAKPRVIYLEDETSAAVPATPTPTTPATSTRREIHLEGETTVESGNEPVKAKARREIDLHARRSESQLTKLVEQVSEDTASPVLSREAFAQHLNAEWRRHRNGGKDGAVASLVLSELDAVKLRMGKKAADELFAQVAEEIIAISRPLDTIGMAGDYELAILMPEMDEAATRQALDHLAKRVAANTFTVRNERVLLTPATGFAMLSDTASSPDLIRAVETARAVSMLNMHLDAERWDDHAAPAHAAPSGTSDRAWATAKAKLRTPFQILLTFVIAWVMPFCIYVAMAAVGVDITYAVYLLFVASLVITGGFILAEGAMAVRQKEPPEIPADQYPKASALIAAYMPNEAGTIIETIDAFLAIDYPNDLQIILAYNTPDPLPVEEHLDRIAAEHPNFVPVRVVGSNSKAQNVNAVLSMAEGEFIGMFDADHQPRPDAFTRAWRWIDSGYDVVQGHCLTRNGDAGFLAKMIAVEFESIYAVAHPGRAKMHRFGVFGGSNGFWRTELLHETRMRGSMLTEDIDSSMRVVERGFKIRSDRDLVSRELATTTFQQVWNQRMRWAQGWFQVSLEHMKLAFRSKDLTRRQKAGIFHLLMWREFYPWLSQQLFPLLAFWSVQAGGLERLDWTIPIFVATSIFTFCVGPLQTLFAYKLADDEIKQHKSWFWLYLLFTTPFYTEYKNLIARVAHIKEFMKESDWRVTPRSADDD